MTSFVKPIMFYRLSNYGIQKSHKLGNKIWSTKLKAHVRPMYMHLLKLSQCKISYQNSSTGKAFGFYPMVVCSNPRVASLVFLLFVCNIIVKEHLDDWILESTENRWKRKV